MELLVDMLKTALPLFVSFAVTAVFTPLVIWIATRRGWVASPREDRWHQRPTALMGGIGIFAGTLASWAVFIRDPALLAVVVPAAAIFVLGVLDDRLNLKPHVKLVAQLAAGISALLMGLQFDAIPQWIAVGLALFWLTGITNGINLLDNMDGLAAGVGGISALAMAVYGVANGDGTTVPTAFGLAGACFGFLVFNFHPARIFMGDCGSLFIGFALAALAINGTHRTAPNLVLALLVPVATLAIPIFDTALVSAARTFHGRPISRGGRDHLSHRLVSLGLSERRTVLVLYALTAIFGSLSIATTTLPLLVVLVLSVLLFLALAILGLFLGHIKVYPKSEDLPPHARLLSQNPSYKRQLAQVFCDMILIPMAFLGAHLLRFEAVLTLEIRDTIFQVLPVVLGLKLIGMLACRAYRGLWRYAEPVDAVTAMLGSTAGSLLSALAIGLWTQFHGISRAALIIDWLVFTCLAVGVRMSYVVLRELFGMVPPTEGARVLLLGAGPECIPIIRRLRDPFVPRRAVMIGILDDDPATRGRCVCGVTVVGEIEDLPELMNAHRVTCCLLGVSPECEDGGRILAYCRQRGIPVYRDLVEGEPVRPWSDLPPKLAARNI